MESNRNDQYEQILNKLSAEVDSLNSKQSEEAKMSKTVGNSPAIRRVLDQIYMVAPTSMTVILQGESGTGKELFSSLIHQRSTRSKNEYLALDCGAIPDSLIESELFGYEKGAFTGAISRKQGVFERANGGTLLLDEITNLNQSAQTKLLRVLQERKFTRISGTKSISFDVRIIAASNIKISEAVKKGAFRLDLYHRLNEFQVDLPLLCERLDDIPVLAKYYLLQTNIELNKQISSFTLPAMKKLISYRWPGNVRELRNIVRRAVLFCSGDVIDLEHIILNEILENIDQTYIEQIESGKGLKEIISDVSKRIERNLINYALEKTKGNKSKAANFLQIERMTLYSKLKEMHASSENFSKK
ncbi:MAG: sigma-54-dependent Fis family transcriptional regulator [Candidatus Cloacimonetes bacterium]|nr:sigma-54-dependent Fis family transcriptional regulator [Candidatus Cloacimonadota bacterium]